MDDWSLVTLAPSCDCSLAGRTGVGSDLAGRTRSFLKSIFFARGNIGIGKLPRDSDLPRIASRGRHSHFDRRNGQARRALPAVFVRRAAQAFRLGNSRSDSGGSSRRDGLPNPLQNPS